MDFGLISKGFSHLFMDVFLMDFELISNGFSQFFKELLAEFRSIVFLVQKDFVQMFTKFGNDFPWTFDPFGNVLAYQLSFFLVSTCKQALSPLFGPAECARRVSVKFWGTLSPKKLRIAACTSNKK